MDSEKAGLVCVYVCARVGVCVYLCNVTDSTIHAHTHADAQTVPDQTSGDRRCNLNPAYLFVIRML